MTAPAASSRRIRRQRVVIEGRITGILTAGPEAGPAVLLVHGFSGDVLSWQFTIAPLARHHRVVAVDLPGHGWTEAGPALGFWRTMVPWLAGVIAALGLRQPWLIGHSLGARLALGLVEADPDAASRLSLIACAGLSETYNYALLERLTTIATLDDARHCATILFGGAADGQERFAQSLLTGLAEPRVQANLRRYLSQNFADGKLLPSRPVDWAGIRCPVQLIWGRDDPVVALPPSDWLPPAARIDLLDQVGHLPHLTAPDRVNQLLLGFGSA